MPIVPDVVPIVPLVVPDVVPIVPLVVPDVVPMVPLVVLIVPEVVPIVPLVVPLVVPMVPLVVPIVPEVVPLVVPDVVVPVWAKALPLNPRVNKAARMILVLCMARKLEMWKGKNRCWGRCQKQLRNPLYA